MLSIAAPAERIDGLVVIADDRHVPVRLREQRDQLGLGAVRVLELVDKEVSEARRRSRSGARRRLADEAEGERDLVAEVDEPVRREQLLVARVRAGELGLAPAVLRGRVRPHRCVDRRGPPPPRAAAASAPSRSAWPANVAGVMSSSLQRLNSVDERRQEAGRVAERAIGVEVELEQVLAQEDDGLGARQHANVGRQPELERVLADQPVAEGMERRDRGVRIAVRHELVDAHGHLVGRLVGERQGEDLRWAWPVASR